MSEKEEVMSEKEEVFSIVGSEYVLNNPEVLEEYSKDHSFTPQRKPDLVVKPKNPEEVQKIVRWANATNTPLIPVSSGPPHFRGDTIPRMGGVVVDLSRMNKIEWINRKNKIACVEPGVTFAQLQPELKKEGLKLPAPLLPRSTKSVIGSFLEREPVLTPRYQWDVSDPLRCVEVVFGNGELLRSGEASGPGTIEQQRSIGGAQIWPEGPHQVDYHRIIQGAQGTMGIVTWASLKCETLPKVQKLFFVSAQEVESLFSLVYRLLKVNYGDEILILNNLDLACLLGSDAADIEERSEILPPWTLIFCLAGYDRYPEERVAYQENYVKDIVQQFGLELKMSLPGAGESKVLEALSGTKDPYWKLLPKGECEDIFFITTLDRTPPFIQTMYEVASRLSYPTGNIGVYLEPMVQGTSCHCEFDLFYEPSQKEKVQELSNLVSCALMAKGAFFSRPYGAWSDMVYSQSAEYTAALRKVKGIFDPQGVMNPGKLCF